MVRFDEMVAYLPVEILEVEAASLAEESAVHLQKLCLRRLDDSRTSLFRLVT
jgi:hypothetical protein